MFRNGIPIEICDHNIAKKCSATQCEWDLKAAYNEL